MAPIIQGLYAIADNTFRPEWRHVQLAEAYLQGGASIVQLRAKGSSVARRESSAIMRLKGRYDFIFIVNDHVAIAKEVGADGVHVGANDMPVATVREGVGDKMLIGYSAHSLEEAMAAERAGSDYVAFGAIFPTKTKGPGHPEQGLEKLRKVVRALSVPAVAIGGIHRENITSVLETGVSAIAMITALTEAPDIAAAAKFYATCFSHRRL